MLVLTRSKDESIVIGDSIVVRVHSISQNRVRLAIDAPREITILRAEILQRPPKETDAT